MISPCYNCPKRTTTCHAYCKEYNDWSAEQRSKPKAHSQGEIDADVVLKTRKKRLIRYSHEKYDEKRRKR